MNPARKRTIRSVQETSKSPRFNPGRCDDCGEWSRLRGWRLGDWICPYCFHGVEPSDDIEVEVESEWNVPPPNTISGEILGILDGQDELPTREIHDRLNRSSKNYVYKKLRSMLDDGLVEKDLREQSYWTLNFDLPENFTERQDFNTISKGREVIR